MIHTVLGASDQRLAEYLATRFYFHARGSWLDLLAEFDTAQAGPGFPVPSPNLVAGGGPVHADDWATVRRRAWTRAVVDWSHEFQQRATEGVRVHRHNPTRYAQEEELIARLTELATQLPAPAPAPEGDPDDVR